MTTWKWRALNRQPFGELLYPFIRTCLCVPLEKGEVIEVCLSVPKKVM